MVQVAEVLSPQEERIKQGKGTGLVGADAQEKRSRIHKMLEGFRNKPIRLNLERARLLTESFAQTEGQPTVLRWGKALAHILANIPIHIEENELVVGSAGPPGRFAVLYPELEDAFFSQEARPSQPGEPLIMTEEDVKIINEELKPYWEGKQFHTAFVNALPEDTRRIVELFRSEEHTSELQSHSFNSYAVFSFKK